LEAGGAAPIILNAANELAVSAFLQGLLRFPQITETVARALDESDFSAPQSIEDVLEIDRATRSSVQASMSERCP
jgi:1-deoxy-D-xylulose-5-phosphate reductoisomerase